MIPQYFEFQTTIQKFIEEAIPQLTDVNRAWISLYIHLSACDEQQTLVTITSFYSQMHKHAKLIEERDAKLIEEVESIIFVINEELYTLPLNEFWQHIKSDNYNIKMFWKWIKKMYDLSCLIVGESNINTDQNGKTIKL